MSECKETEYLLAKALLVANSVIETQKVTIADQTDIIRAYQIINEVEIDKQKLESLLNRKIRELAEKQFGRRYNEAYIAVYDEFAKLHCFRHKVDMKFLRTNIDYLGECLKLVLEKLN